MSDLTDDIFRTDIELAMTELAARAQMISELARERDVLRDVLADFVAGWDEALPYINSVTSSAHIHGVNYGGPDLSPQVAAAKAALAASAGGDA